MPYKVTPQGDILCDTAEEAISLARAMAGEGPIQRRIEGARDSDVGSVKWPESRYREFKSLIKGDQIKFIDLLLDKPHGMTDRAVRQSLGMNSNLQLAGVTAGLAKNAKKVGVMSTQDLFIKDVMHQGDERVLMYKLADEFRVVAERIYGREK